MSLESDHGLMRCTYYEGSAMKLVRLEVLTTSFSKPSHMGAGDLYILVFAT